MTSSIQVIIALVALGLFSFLLATIYKFSELLRLHHRHRLVLLRGGFLLCWVVSVVAVIAQLWRASAVGLFLPLPAFELGGRRLVAVASALPSWEESGLHWSHILVGLYALGAGGLLLHLVISFMRAKNCLRDARPVACGERILYSSPKIGGPFTFGIWNPKIFIPDGLLRRQTKQAIELILRHEETHIERGDLRWKVFALVTRAFLFFSPAIHFLTHRMDLEMEMECDRITMEKADVNARVYGAVLLDMASELAGFRRDSIFAYMSDSHLNLNLRRRILAMKARTTGRPALWGALSAMALMGGFSAIAAVTGAAHWGGRELARNTFSIQTEILIEGQLVASPRFMVLADEPASMEQKWEDPESHLLLVALVASDALDSKVPDGIRLKMRVDYKDPNRSFQAKPQVITKPGEKATVTISPPNSAETIEMRIVAERQ